MPHELLEVVLYHAIQVDLLIDDVFQHLDFWRRPQEEECSSLEKSST
jgi:hypothetical protein